MDHTQSRKGSLTFTNLKRRESKGLTRTFPVNFTLGMTFMASVTEFDPIHDVYDIYKYTAVYKNFEPLIYISIYIYRVHCGKGSTRKFTSRQTNLDKHTISSIY